MACPVSRHGTAYNGRLTRENWASDIIATDIEHCLHDKMDERGECRSETGHGESALSMRVERRIKSVGCDDPSIQSVLFLDAHTLVVGTGISWTCIAGR